MLSVEVLVFGGCAAGVFMAFATSALLFLRRYRWRIRRASWRLLASFTSRQADEHLQLVNKVVFLYRRRLVACLVSTYAAVALTLILVALIQIKQGESLLLVHWCALTHAAFFAVYFWIPAILDWDSFYVVFAWSFIFYLSPMATGPTRFADVNSLLLLLLRLPTVIIPRHVAAVVLSNAGYFAMIFARMETDWSREADPSRSSRLRLLGVELLSGLVVIAFFICSKAFLRKNAEEELAQGTSSQLSQQLTAATSLLHLACDTVVELDSNLRLRSHSPQLASMLLRNFQGASLAQKKLTDFMPRHDAMRALSHLQDFRTTSTSSPELSQSASRAHCFQSRLVDSAATKLPVEIFQVMYSIGGETRHLVGIKELNDYVADDDESEHSAQEPSADQSASSTPRSYANPTETSQSARVCLHLDAHAGVVLSSTSPMTEVVGKPLVQLFPQHVCHLMRRICQEGGLFLERGEPLPGRTFSFDDLPVEWPSGKGRIHGWMQLAQHANGSIHVMLFFDEKPSSPMISPRSSNSRSSESKSRRNRRTRKEADEAHVRHSLHLRGGIQL